MRKNEQVVTLPSTPFQYEQDRLYALRFEAKGSRLALYIDDTLILEAQDKTFIRGGAGFVIERGTMAADGFAVAVV
jgi:hypothetical protein